MTGSGSRNASLAKEVLIRPLRSDDSVEVSDLLTIYEEAIPPTERKRPEAVRRMLDSPDYRVLGAFSKQQLVGFLVAYAFQLHQQSLLEYMAVKQGWQGQGIGGRLLGELLATKGMSYPLLLEVDSDHFSSADRELRTARKRFYRRLGCREVAGLIYQLPLPGNPPPMDLLVYWPDREWVKRATIKQWLTAIYTEVYSQSESDPRIPSMLGGLPDLVSLI